MRHEPRHEESNVVFAFLRHEHKSETNFSRFCAVILSFLAEVVMG